MNGFWVVSSVLLWVVVIALAVLVLGMLQQIGLLHQRLDGGSTPESDAAPGGVIPEHEGPELGTRLPDMVAETANGHGSLRLALEESDDVEGQSTLVPCMQPLCESCQHLVDPLNALATSGDFPGRVIVLLRSEGADLCQSFLSVFPLQVPVICEQARAIMKSLDVHGSLFSLLYGQDGALVAKGITKSEAELLAFLHDAAAPAAVEGADITSEVVS